jgi:hypothetical protein
LYGLATHQYGVLIMRDLAREEPVYGIILEQIGQIANMRQIVDRHDLDVGQGERAPQDHAANTSKTVNANTTCHTLLLLSGYG